MSCPSHTLGCQTVCTPTHSPCSPRTPCTPTNVPDNDLVGLIHEDHLLRILNLLNQLNTSNNAGTSHISTVGNQSNLINETINQITDESPNRINAKTFNNIIDISRNIQNRFCQCVNQTCTNQTAAFCRCHQVCSCNQVQTCSPCAPCNTT